MNQARRNVDRPPRRGPDRARDWLSSDAAAAILGVKRQTLYAYASRGLVRTAPGGGGSRSRLYHREDLERLEARGKARAGHGAVAAGALRWGEPVLETSVGEIRADGPSYRGRSAVELAGAGASFEEVCALLWGGDFLPPQGGGLGVSPGAVRALLRAEAEPFEAMLVTASALATNEPRGEAPDVMRRRAGALVRRLVASCAIVRGADAVAAAMAADGTARSVLLALGGATTKASVAAMTQALVLSADHDLNASTFAARVAASSGATLAASVVAALAALSGPRHGAATARVEALVAEIERPERAPAVIAGKLARGEAVPGFGHPLYPGGDPRGIHLLELACHLPRKTRPVRALVAATSAMSLAAREKPTVDVGLVALAAALGLPRGAPLAIFACGRLAGWIAHALEQHEAGYLLRPRARYVGVRQAVQG